LDGILARPTRRAAVVEVAEETEAAEVPHHSGSRVNNEPIVALSCATFLFQGRQEFEQIRELLRREIAQQPLGHQRHSNFLARGNICRLHSL